jgi:hypothetical protein
MNKGKKGTLRSWMEKNRSKLSSAVNIQEANTAKNRV